MQLTEKQIKALKEVIQYNWADERRDFEQNPCINHFFEHLVVLDNLVSGTNYTAEAWIENGPACSQEVE